MLHPFCLLFLSLLPSLCFILRCIIFHLLLPRFQCLQDICFQYIHAINYLKMYTTDSRQSNAGTPAELKGQRDKVHLCGIKPDTSHPAGHQGKLTPLALKKLLINKLSIVVGVHFYSVLVIAIVLL